MTSPDSTEHGQTSRFQRLFRQGHHVSFRAFSLNLLLILPTVRIEFWLWRAFHIFQLGTKALNLRVCPPYKNAGPSSL